MIDAQSFARQLQDAMPQVITSEKDARFAVDVIFSQIHKGLKNRDFVEIHGVGEFRVEPDGGKKNVVFTPSPQLVDGINE